MDDFNGGIADLNLLYGQAISELITRAIKDTPIRHTGYSGLMLPVLEDQLLAEVSTLVAAPPSQLLRGKDLG